MAVSSHPRGSALSITVIPRASRSSLEQSADAALRVRIAAPPVDGAANAALLRFLADVLNVPRSRLQIIAGASGRYKRVAFSDIEPDVLEARLQHALSEGR